MNDKELVRSADNMDVNTFAKHMSFRHSESLGGLTELVLRREDSISQAYRSFHRRLHAVRVDIPHEHGGYQAAPGEEAEAS